MRSGTVRNGNEPDNDAGGRLTSFLEWNAIRLSQVEGEVQLAVRHSDDERKWKDTGIDDGKIKEKVIYYHSDSPSFCKLAEKPRS
ncbi:unnamed protein product [Callosobruchus maculatus]|uniref:Uncharacterized protein n=1 Tax=Callosobruchus maculatus TaxID=64391 RepID=A0A653C691_CALMS|nr:unnamed protein product [Callosobruchus maculatus]